MQKAKSSLERLKNPDGDLRQYGRPSAYDLPVQFAEFNYAAMERRLLGRFRSTLIEYRLVPQRLAMALVYEPKLHRALAIGLRFWQ